MSLFRTDDRPRARDGMHDTEPADHQLRHQFAEMLMMDPESGSRGMGDELVHSYYSRNRRHDNQELRTAAETMMG
jgi:hypothetical protein